MIPLSVFLGKIAEIAAEKPAYRLGGSAQRPQAASIKDYDRFGAFGCDCIGLIIGAYRRAGGIWRGTHGSNWARRHMMATFGPVAGYAVGDIVYKAHAPGDAGYNLPLAYVHDPDQRDYYHVGVVTSANPLRITHCTSWRGGSGIKVDTRRGKWLYGGRLAGIDYDAAQGPVPLPSQDVVAPALPATRTLRVIKGLPLMRGDDVRVVQDALLARGYSVGPTGADGVYGWATQRAVLAYQMAAFPASAADWDGVVGPKTRQALGV